MVKLSNAAAGVLRVSTEHGNQARGRSGLVRDDDGFSY